MCKCGKVVDSTDEQQSRVTKVRVLCINCTTPLRSRIGISYPVHAGEVYVSDYIVREWEALGYEFIYE